MHTCVVYMCKCSVHDFSAVSETLIKAYTWSRRCGGIPFEDDSQTAKDILLQWENECFK